MTGVKSMAYYEKLPIVLLSELASGREDSYNCRIAAWLLKHLGEQVSAEEIARACFVSKSAVSRFCREVGLEDFYALREMLATAGKHFERLGDTDVASQSARVASLGAESMLLAGNTIDTAALDCLAREIATAPRIACFGLLKAQAAALNLQCDLTMLGKQAFTKIAFREQMEYLKNASSDDLIVVFSYRGMYFDYDLPCEARNTHAKLWMVTGNRSRTATQKKPLLQGVITFESRLDFASHPYQLMAAAGILAQRAAIAISALPA